MRTLNHSVSELTAHVVFAYKYRKSYLMRNTWFIRLACEKACVNVIEIGTAENHIHLLFRFSANQRLSDIIGMIKSCSSREISKYDNSFPGWQTGYYVSSIGNTKLGNIQDYLKNQ